MKCCKYTIIESTFGQLGRIKNENKKEYSFYNGDACYNISITIWHEVIC